MQAVLVHLLRPSILVRSVTYFLSSSTSESFLEVRGNCWLSVIRFIAEAICTNRRKCIRIMWPNIIGRCSNFVCNSERDAAVRRLSGILMCGGFERFESLLYVRSYMSLLLCIHCYINVERSIHNVLVPIPSSGRPYRSQSLSINFLNCISVIWIVRCWTSWFASVSIQCSLPYKWA
jgi:hypothetical protein